MSKYLQRFLLMLIYQICYGKNLHSTLLQDYNVLERPIKNQSEPMKIDFQIELIQIVEINDEDQTMKIRARIKQNWFDGNLRWNESAWNGKKQIQMNPKDIWVPDITLQNNANDESGRVKHHSNVVVHSSGKVFTNELAMFVSTCKLNLKKFPFDQQMCILNFTSWSYNASDISVTPSTIGFVTNDYFPSSQWELKSYSIESSKRYHPCCDGQFSLLSYQLKIHRKSLYYVRIVITPFIILVVTIFFGFFLSPDSGGRITLSVTVLLSVTVFVQLVNKSIPQNSDTVPLLGVFYILILVESVVSVLSTCIVLTAYNRSIELKVKRIPSLVACVFIKVIAKLLFVKRDDEKVNKIEYCAYALDLFEIKKKCTVREVKEVDHEAFHNARSMKLLKDIVNELQKMRALMLRKEDSNETEELREEWRYLAKILNRFFFLIYFVTFFGIIIGVLA